MVDVDYRQSISDGTSEIRYQERAIYMYLCLQYHVSLIDHLPNDNGGFGQLENY